MAKPSKKPNPFLIWLLQEKNAQIIFAQEKRYVTDWDYQHHQLQATVADIKTDARQTYQLDLTGIYQTKNIITVLEAAHQLHLQGWNLDEKILEKSLSHVKKLTGLHGRWEIIHENPAIILDVGHNEDGIKQIAEQLELMTYNELHIVIGMVKDKEVSKVLSLLPKTAIYYFTKAQIPRAMNENELNEIAAAIGLHGKTFSEVNAALDAAKQHAHKDDVILVCGSVYLIGEVNY